MQCSYCLVDALGFLLVVAGDVVLESRWHGDRELVEAVRETAVGEPVHVDALLVVEPIGMRKVKLWISLLLLLLLLLTHQVRLQVETMVSETLSRLKILLLIHLLLLLLLSVQEHVACARLVGTVHKGKLTVRNDGRIEGRPVGEVVAVCRFVEPILRLSLRQMVRLVLLETHERLLHLWVPVSVLGCLLLLLWRLRLTIGQWHATVHEG